MFCEKCGKEFFEDWRKSKKARKKPLRFCSINCSNAREITEEEKEKISKTLKKKHSEGKIQPWNKGVENKEDLKKFFKNKRVVRPKNLKEVSKRTASKIMLRLNKTCSICGWDKDGMALDIHHIIEKSKGGTDDHFNLTYICPNCHRMAHSGLLKEEEFITLEEQVGDEWLEYFYG